jgi:hypothetical protein
VDKSVIKLFTTNTPGPYWFYKNEKKEVFFLKKRGKEEKTTAYLQHIVDPSGKNTLLTVNPIVVELHPCLSIV